MIIILFRRIIITFHHFPREKMLGPFLWAQSRRPAVAGTGRARRKNGRRRNGAWNSGAGEGVGKRWYLIGTVMAMATSYNWLFLWDEKHSINGVTC